MAETLTNNYGWTKPDPGASSNTWGTTLNATFDKIDTQVFTNGKRGVEIGSGALWFTATPPANWLLCNGQSLSTAAPYDKLFAVFGYTFGGSGANFNLPNFSGRVPIGGTPGAASGATTATLATANLPAHAHGITDVAHGHGVNQWAHSHGISTGGHTHTVFSVSHAHSGNLLRFVGTGGSYGIAGGGNSNVNAGNTDANGTGNTSTDNPGNLGGNTDAQTSAISIQTSGTGLSTTNNTGSGAAFSIMQPSLGVNIIVKYQ